jgi:hypothetical protein
VKFFEIFFLQLFACLRLIVLFILNRQTIEIKKRRKEMRNFLIFLVAVAASVVVAEAADVVVLKGGSLWQITEAAGRSGAEWHDLYAINSGLPRPVRRGGVIDVRVYPGQILTLPAGWGTGGINPAILRVIVPPAPPASQPTWWQQAWGWAQINKEICG